MIYYSETYEFLKKAAEKGKYVVKMGGRGSGKTYSLEQLLTLAIKEADKLRSTVKCLEETLQEYEKAMQERSKGE